MEYSHEIITGIFALLGTTLGLVFPPIVEYLKFRNNQRKEINRIIASGLEVWFVFFSSDVKALFKVVLEALKSELGNIRLSEQDEKSILETWKTFTAPITNDIQKRRLDNIRGEYNEAVSSLASYLPVLSFQLRDMESLYDDMGKIEDYINDLQRQFHDKVGAPDELKSFLEDKIRPTKDLASDMEINLLGIAMRYHVWQYLGLKWFFYHKKRNKRKEAEKQGVQLGRIINNAAKKAVREKDIEKRDTCQ